MTTLLIDVGGTKIRLAKATARGWDAVLTIRTPKTWPQALASMTDIVGSLPGPKCQQVILGLPGTMDDRQRVLVRASNLPQWRDAAIVRDIRRAHLASQVRVENDAHLAALGEAVYGAGKKYAIVAYLGVGTGVGGARIVNQRLDIARHGFRPGHMMIDCSSSARCGCGQCGDLESLVSGSGMARHYGHPAENLPERVWRTAARQLGIGLNTVSVMWQPEVIVLGGSVMPRLWKYRAELSKGLRYRTHIPRLVRATLGDFAGLYGGVALLNQSPSGILIT